MIRKIKFSTFPTELSVVCLGCARFGGEYDEKRSFELLDSPKISRDGYKNGVCECCGSSITGGNVPEEIYGVFAFLEKYAGMRFFLPTLETYGDGDIIVNEGCKHE